MQNIITALSVCWFAITFAAGLKSEARYRFIAVVLMMTVFLMQTFSSCFIVADYYANTSSFAKDCINKARPELHCNGKCQMRKQIGSEEKKDQQNPERKDNRNEVTFTVISSDIFLTPAFSQQPILYPSFLTGKERKMPRVLLRPPIAA